MKPEKIKLVARLARDGATQGERDAAMSILDSLGIKLNDLENDEKEVHVTLKYKTSFEKSLIMQTYYRVMNIDHVSFFQTGKRRIIIPVPVSKSNQLKQSISTILKLWRNELKRFGEAFIQANRLFSDLPPEDDSQHLSREEIQEILNMASSIKTATLDNLLEE